MLISNQISSTFYYFSMICSKGHSIRVKFYEYGSGSSASRRGLPQPAVNLGMQCSTCKLSSMHAIEQSLKSKSRVGQKDTNKSPCEVFPFGLIVFVKCGIVKGSSSP